MPIYTCSLCNTESPMGGLHTNGDPYGDAKHVDLEAPEEWFFCWDCVNFRGGDMRNFEGQLDQAFADRGWCGTVKEWVGRCRNPKPCPEHS